MAGSVDSRAGRYGALLGSLALAMVVVPPLAESGFDVLAAALVYPIVLAVSALAVVDAPRWRTPMLGLGLAAIAGDVVLHTTDRSSVVVAARLLFTVFEGAVGAILLGRIVRETRVSLDTILGGICVYLLIGLLFGSAFGLVEYVDPGAFALGGVPMDAAEGVAAVDARSQDLVYFSLVTLTTLGYGDITPVAPLARMLATAEALVGQLYLAVFVASLVGLHLAARQGHGG